MFSVFEYITLESDVALYVSVGYIVAEMCLYLNK